MNTIILIAVALIFSTPTVLAVIALKRVDDLRAPLNMLKSDIQEVKNKVECVDHNIHTLAKNQKEHHDAFLELEKTKSEAFASFRGETEQEHKALAQGIEDRYQNVYDEFQHISEHLGEPHECCCHGEVNLQRPLDIPRTPVGEKVLKAKQLKEAGKSNKEIADLLGVAESTVRGYLKRPGITSPDEKDPLGMPQIDDPASYYKFVHKVVDEKLNEATDGKTIGYCPFSATQDPCDYACSDACIDCVVSARAFNLLD